MKLGVFIAIVFRTFFKISYFRQTFYGFHQHLFAPFNLFKGIRKRIIYRDSILLDLDIADWIQQNLYFLNEYEEKEIKFLEQYLKNGDVFIDIGANIGLFTLVASKIVGADGLVYAFEPMQNSFDSLSAHLQLNNSKNVIAEKLAVSNGKDFIELYIDANDKNSGMASSYINNYTLKECVLSTSIDDYLSQKGDVTITLIKIDIEGGEYLALKGMEQTLKKYKPALLIEINPEIIERTPFTQNDIAAFLNKLGYRKYFIDNFGLPVQTKMSNDQSNNYLFL
jgi:FkbM family methyltransferase